MKWPSSIDTMASLYPDFYDLKGCVQEPKYHAEGDVWIHTQMVVDKVHEIIERVGCLTEFEKNVLVGSSWFHDISKPECTVIGDTITSKGHSLKGSKRARRLMYRRNIPFYHREEICNLVLNHSVPLHFMENENMKKKILEPKETCDLNLLSFLAEADVRGRICEDQQTLIDLCEMYREYAKEYKDFQWDSNYARYDYFQRRDGNFDYQAYNNTKFNVIMLCGLAGSGKNTWIEKYWSGPVVSLDTWREKLKIKPTDDQGQVAQSALEEAKTYLRKQEPFVWNATNYIRDRRIKLINIFSEYHANTRLVYIEAPYKDILRRNHERPYEAQLPIKALEKMIDSLEVPAPYEAPSVEYKIEV